MVNVVEILCTYVCKWKNETFETIPLKRRIKENDGGGEFNCDIL
jgi:hypothetical protein